MFHIFDEHDIAGAAQTLLIFSCLNLNR